MFDWDKSFLRLARFWANERSKDPSTKTGAVIVRPNKTVASLGYNGFPPGVIDSEERYNNREEKSGFVTHAEQNAILRSRESLEGYTIYIYPLFTCNKCAQAIITAGIKRVVAPKPDLNDEPRMKLYGFDKAQIMYQESGVKVDFLVDID